VTSSLRLANEQRNVENCANSPVSEAAEFKYEATHVVTGDGLLCQRREARLGLGGGLWHPKEQDVEAADEARVKALSSSGYCCAGHGL
jgi:hypothetical protein